MASSNADCECRTDVDRVKMVPIHSQLLILELLERPYSQHLSNSRNPALKIVQELVRKSLIKTYKNEFLQMFRPRLVQGPSEALWAIGLFLSLSPNGDFERQVIRC